MSGPINHDLAFQNGQVPAINGESLGGPQNISSPFKRKTKRRTGDGIAAGTLTRNEGSEIDSNQPQWSSGRGLFDT